VNCKKNNKLLTLKVNDLTRTLEKLFIKK